MTISEDIMTVSEDIMTVSRSFQKNKQSWCSLLFSTIYHSLFIRNGLMNIISDSNLYSEEHDRRIRSQARKFGNNIKIVEHDVLSHR